MINIYTKSPFTPNESFDGSFKEKELNPTSILSSLDNWSDYLIWTLITLFSVWFLYSIGRLAYGIIARNGEIKKSGMFGAMVSVFMLLVVRVGFLLFFAVSEYGLNRFLMDLVTFSSSSLVYLAVGMMILSAGFYFVYYLIKHPAIRRRSNQFLVGASFLILASFIVPMIFLQI